MVGQTIAHYKILEELGGGGMGVVYRAEDLNLQRTVALKFLPSSVTRDPQLKKRFAREAQAASALDHPNICTIYEIHETQAGQIFIAMAFYKGETLEKKVARGLLDISEAVQIALQLAYGLAEAHSRGVIHRDIKPANIMVTANGRVKILDFGLAKLEGESTLTQPGNRMGTLSYMSPEQIEGTAVDHRADLWAAGVVLYELLTGQRPFHGEYEAALVYSILNDPPEPIRSKRPELPARLAAVVHRMIARNPDERYQSADEFIEALQIVTKSRDLTGPAAPTTVGKYEIFEKLGTGGMGEIYRARDPLIGREVAIKIIREQALKTPELKQRLYKEAQAAGRLSHENIAVVHDVDEQDGAPFIVMELLTGANLHTLIRSNADLSLAQKLDIATQICRGLQYAHSHEVVHRDIKPANIIVLENGRVKITDFGVAQVKSETGSLTHSSIGTPSYMSPEQIRGAPVDHRTDIFSFGVLLYELLTSQNPFSGDRVTTVIYKILETDPEPINLKEVDLSANLQQILERCLRKDPRERYSDVEALLQDLNALGLHSPQTLTASLPANDPVSSDRTQISNFLFHPAFQKTRLRIGFLLVVVTAFIGYLTFNHANRLSPLNELFSSQTQMSVLKQQSADVQNSAAVNNLPEQNPGKQQQTSAEQSAEDSVSAAAAQPSSPPNDQRKVLQTSADNQRKQMLAHKSAAQRAGAPAAAPQRYKKAQAREHSGSSAYQLATPNGYYTAQTAFLEASQLYQQARQAALNRPIAETAKEAMQQARALVAKGEIPPGLVTAFDQAETLSQQALNQFEQETFADAAQAFENAEQLYRKLSSALQESAALTANQKAAAEQARSNMRAAKDTVPKASQQYSSYKKALLLERKAAQLFDQKRFEEAAKQFKSAAKGFLTAAQQSTFREQTEQALQTLIRRYEKALEQKNIDQLEQLLPPLTSQERQMWLTFFHTARAIQVSIQPVNLEIGSTRANVVLQVELNYLDNKNRSQTQSYSTSWILQPAKNTWKISDTGKP